MKKVCDKGIELLNKTADTKIKKMEDVVHEHLN